MQKVNCDICDRTELPLNETIKIDGHIHCESCVNFLFPNAENLKDKVVEKELDPTVCSSCKEDFGDTLLQKISVYPVCEGCAQTIKNRTFPNWVKAFMAGIVIIVAISFVWNWRFYQAFKSINKVGVLLEEGDLNGVYNTVKYTSDKVPEQEDLKIMVSYYKGVVLLNKDSSSLALVEFKKCEGKVPDEWNLNQLLLRARIGAAFDEQNYSEFLTAAMENLSIADSSDAEAYATVASAYACLYAGTGIEDTKTKSMEYLQVAKSMDSENEEALKYYNAIEYRLHSRNIINREEFDRRFPNGWTNN